MLSDLATATPTMLAALGVSGVAAILAYRTLVKAMRRGRRLPLPPGPPGLPIVGNLFDIPAEDFWWKYKEWGDQYGSDVIYLNVLGSDVVVLNSLAACRELLEQRSAVYSSRPRMPMMNELIGFDWHFGFIPYGDAWKERRKLFTQAFGPHTAASHYRPVLLRTVRSFLLHILNDPHHFRAHTRLFSGASILLLTYGLHPTSPCDPSIAQAEQGMAAMAAAGTASSYLVDFLPLLQYLPSWLPGARFKRDAAAWKPSVRAMASEPVRFVEEGMRAGTARACVATELLRDLDEADVGYEARRKVIRDVLASVYAAGSDTTVSTITTFFLAMAQYPHVQAKAQASLSSSPSSYPDSPNPDSPPDALIPDALPDFSQYESYPYITALVRELLRWRPVTPIGVPHAFSPSSSSSSSFFSSSHEDDDTYRGYRIPAGATVLPNCYAIAHDEGIYGPDPHLFNPGRFMDESETQIRYDAPMGYETFGFGRRVCPGLHVAVESVWLVVVSVLSTFTIRRVDHHGLEKRVDEGGKEDNEGKEDKEGKKGKKDRGQWGKYTSGMLIHPLPFDVEIVPRSGEAEALVRSGAAATSDDE